MLNYLQMIRTKILAECNYILTGDATYLDRVKEVMDYFLTLVIPRNLDGNSTENYIIQQRRNFEAICVVMMEHGIHNPDDLTVIRFHAAMKHLEAKTKQNVQ